MPESRKVWQTGSSEMPPPFWNVLPQGTSLLPTIISGNCLLILLSWADCHFVRSFPALHFDVTKVSGVTDRTPEARLSFAYRSRKKCMWIAIIVVTACFYLSGVKYWWHFRAIKIKLLLMCPRENVYSVWFYPQLFLTQNYYCQQTREG